MESQRSKCVECIYPPFYNMSPILGSVPQVLTSPDTEISPPNPQNSPASFTMKTLPDRSKDLMVIRSQLALKYIQTHYFLSHLEEIATHVMMGNVKSHNFSPQVFRCAVSGMKMPRGYHYKHIRHQFSNSR